MDALQYVLIDAFGLAVTFFVSGFVWVMLTIGFYQLVRDKLGQVRVMPRRSRRMVRESYSQQAS